MSDCLVISLSKLPRRQHRPLELLQQVQTLRQRGYDDRVIAGKIGVTPEWVSMLGALFDKGEQRLIQAVETGVLPVSMAVEIARVSDGEAQAALARAYSEKKLRGKKLTLVRRLLEQRARGAARHPKSVGSPRSAQGDL